MQVGYSRGWAIGFLVLGAITFGLNLITTNPFGLISGGVCLVLGFAYLRRPYFVIEPGRLVVPAVLGPLKKPYPFSTGGLVVRDGALFLDGKKLGLRRWLADKAAWDAMARQLDGATFD